MSSIKRLVSIYIVGGIGNRICQVLAALGYAKKYNREFIFYMPHFHPNPHSSNKETKEFLFHLFPNVKVIYSPLLWKELKDEEFSDHPASRIVLKGYFQNDKYYPPDMNKWFKIPKPPITHFNISSINFSNTYFIHYRFGDYINSDFEVDLTDYYSKSIEAVKNKNSNVLFLVFSDQPEKVKNDLGIILPVTVGFWESLWLMSKCSGGICANSSFSFCAALALCSKDSIYMPTQWKKEFVKELPYWVNQI